MRAISTKALQNAFIEWMKACHELTDGEVIAIPKLLELLDISGCLITVDAMGCQHNIAQKIIDKNADYLLAVKGNQGKLDKAFDNYYRPAMLQKFDSDSYAS